MKRTIRTLALAVVLFVIAGVAIVTFREPGPRYHSHALGYWLGELASNDVESQARARDAFREMGTNAYPFLMERLEAVPSKRTNPVREWLRCLPFIRSSNSDSLAQSIAAMEALAIIAPPLGPRAPEFVQHITNIPVPGLILANMGEPALEPLAAGLTNNDWQVRFDAAHTLANCTCDISRVHPALLRALDDPHPGVSRMAAKALGTRKSNDKQLVPSLIMKSSNADAPVRLNIIFSLGLLAQTDTNAISALIFAMDDSNPLVRREATNALRQVRYGLPFWVATAVAK